MKSLLTALVLTLASSSAFAITLTVTGISQFGNFMPPVRPGAALTSSISIDYVACATLTQNDVELLVGRAQAGYTLTAKVKPSFRECRALGRPKSIVVLTTKLPAANSFLVQQGNQSVRIQVQDNTTH